MAYTETKTTGYGSRVKSSCGGIGFGIILFIAGTCVLWWNEGRTVRTGDMLDEVKGAYVEMENPNKRDASLDGELIHATAMANTEDSLIDADFGIGAKAISMTRRVEYYQWVEHEHSESKDKLGGSQETTTTYTYTKAWVSSPEESANFKDPAYQKKNFVLTTVEPSDQYAENVTFGAYKLNESQIRSVSSREDVELAIAEDLLRQFNQNAQTAYQRFYGVNTKPAPAPAPAAKPAAVADTVALSDSAKIVADSLQAVADSIKAVTDSLMAKAENKKDLEYVHQAGNMLYFGRVPGAPEVGDVRVVFEKVVPAKVSIMAVVDGDSFKPYKADNDETFEKLSMGKKSADEMIQAAESSNNVMKWLFRLLGVFLVITGLKSVFGIIETILKVVPFVANIVGWGVGVVCTVVGIVWSLIVIAIAWIFYRPLLGITLLVVAGLLIWLFAFKGKDKLKALANKNNAATQAPPAAK